MEAPLVFPPPFSCHAPTSLHTTYFSSLGCSRRCKRSLTTDFCSNTFSLLFPGQNKNNQAFSHQCKTTARAFPTSSAGAHFHYLHNSVLQRAYKKPGKWILLPTWTTDVVPELCSLQPLLSSTSKETSMKPPQVHVTPWSSKHLSSHLGTPLAQPHLVLEDSEMWNDASKQTWMKEGRKSWILQWINA